jgi:hypothetical protein
VLAPYAIRICSVKCLLVKIHVIFNIGPDDEEMRKVLRKELNLIFYAVAGRYCIGTLYNNRIWR